MSEKKNNFLPLLLVGGGAGIAALLIAKNSAKPEEDTSILGGGGFGGSGDFFGNSESYNPAVTPSGGIVTPSGGVPMSSTPVILPILYPDSMDAGIEDIARDDVNLGLTDPSNGGVNPNNYGPSGVDIAQELALYAGASAAVGAAGYGVKKAGSAIKKAGTKAASGTAGKVATTTAGKVANTATEKAASKAGQSAVSVATKAAGTTAGKVASGVAKGAGVLGLLGAVDMVFDITGVKDAHFSQGGLTGNLQGVNTSFSVNTGGITTDKQTTNEVGNMGLTDRQKRYLSNMETFGGTTREATAEEATQINKMLGSSGSVGVYEYSGPTGSQISYVTTSGKTITNPSGVSKSSSSSGGSSKSGTSSGGSSIGSSISSALSSAASSVSNFLSGLFGGK